MATRTSTMQWEPRGLDKLQIQMEAIKERQRHEFDNIWVIDSGGGRGTGKSVAGLWNQAYYNGGLVDLHNVIFNGMELLERFKTGDLGECIIYDEAIRDLYKREAMTIINIVLVKLLDMGRWREKFLMVILPNFWSLDPDIRNIIDARLFLYNRGLERGFTKFFKAKRNEWTKAEPYLDYRFTFKYRNFPRDLYNLYKGNKVDAWDKSLSDFKEILERRTGGGISIKQKVMEALFADSKRSNAEIAREVKCTTSYVQRLRAESGFAPKKVA